VAEDTDEESVNTQPQRGLFVEKPAAKEAPRESDVMRRAEPPAGANEEYLGKLALSRKRTIDQVVAAAKELGVSVIDCRTSGGPVEVRMLEYNDDKRRKLARMLVDRGFRHWPGRGFIAND
jgi:hypothetical protein